MKVDDLKEFKKLQIVKEGRVENVLGLVCCKENLSLGNSARLLASRRKKRAELKMYWSSYAVKNPLLWNSTRLLASKGRKWAELKMYWSSYCKESALLWKVLRLLAMLEYHSECSTLLVRTNQHSLL